MTLEAGINARVSHPMSHYLLLIVVYNLSRNISNVLIYEPFAVYDLGSFPVARTGYHGIKSDSLTASPGSQHWSFHTTFKEDLKYRSSQVGPPATKIR